MQRQLSLPFLPGSAPLQGPVVTLRVLVIEMAKLGVGRAVRPTWMWWSDKWGAQMTENDILQGQRKW